MLITLTPAAIEQVQKQLAARGSGQGILIGTKTTGCSGLAYVIDYVDQPQSLAPAARWEFGGFWVWILQKDFSYLSGLTMDWQRQGLNERFVFNNPNEVARCGCGTSFQV
jgi:iron-sulfur cluster assembly protein